LGKRHFKCLPKVILVGEAIFAYGNSTHHKYVARLLFWSEQGKKRFFFAGQGVILYAIIIYERSQNMETQKQENAILRGMLTGVGMAVLYLLIGVVLDYLVTQLLSQFVLQNCSEDCYFRLFNNIFVAVVVLSVAGGILSGVRKYKRLSETG